MLPDPTPEQRKAFRDLTGRDLNLRRGRFADSVGLIIMWIAILIFAGWLLTIHNPFEVCL